MRIVFQRQLLLLITFGWLLVSCGQATSQPSVVEPAPSSPAGSPTGATVLPAVDQLAAIPQGQTPQGYHTLGADSAPVTLVMYSDFL